MRLLFFLIAIGSALPAQQAPPVVLQAVRQPDSDTLFNLALQDILAPALPYSPAEMVQKHGPLVEDIDPVSSATILATPSNAYNQAANIPGRLFTASAGASFEGPGTGMTGFTVFGAPSDSTMAVGPSHIVAWVNTQYAVFDKAGNKLLPGNGFVNGSTLFSGVSGVCGTTNRGDPIVQYDRLANRWIFSQFAFNVNASGQPISPYAQCIALSNTSDPLGTYTRYVVDFTTIGFNDYGKMGVWPDAYYITFNIFGGSPAGANIGMTSCAHDRAAMLSGAATITVICIATNFYAGGAAFLPADLDGTTLPTDLTQGNPHMRQSTAPALRIMKVKPDFTAKTISYTDGFGGANGTFVNLSTPNTNRACNGGGGTCIPQAGTTNQLDTLGDRLMYRLAYRNRGGVDSLVVTHSVDPDGAGSRASTVRWYEIRNVFLNPPSVFQNANYNPDGNERWMGSIAMDKMGNILLGYSVSSATLNPSIRVTGRLRSELRNQMQAETTVVNGTGSQTGTLTRWGDYTTMQVDPADDCTFWYINQYLSASGTFNWRTRIASFKFGNCQ